jgi:hypothetical protein
VQEHPTRSQHRQVVGSGAGAVAEYVRSVSSPRRFEPCMRFSRTRLTDAVHRRHSVFPARAFRPWVPRRFHRG